MAKAEEELRLVEIDKEAVGRVSDELAENFHCVLTQVLLTTTTTVRLHPWAQPLTTALFHCVPMPVHVERALAAGRRR
jgi:hypothetical protein